MAKTFSFISSFFRKKSTSNTSEVQNDLPQQQPPQAHQQATAVAPVIQSAPPIVLTPNVVQHKITTLSGVGSIFKGDLLAADSVYVAGVHLGNIKVTGQGRIVGVREKAVVEGSVEAETILVGGELSGRIRCKVLKIYSTGVVTGDVEYQRIIICDGGTLNADGVCNSKNVAIGAIFNGDFAKTEHENKSEPDASERASDDAPRSSAPIDLRAVIDHRVANEQKAESRYAGDMPKASVG